MSCRNVCLAVTGALAMMLSGPALAEKTYTPAQLRQMVGSGKPPKQGKPMTQRESMSFSSCVAKVDAIVTSVRDNYPAEVVVKTSVMHLAKLWTNDAAMTLTCSATDRLLIITASKYL